MKRYAKWAAAPIVILIVIGVWMMGDAPAAKVPQSQEHVVVRGDLLISVTEPGTLKALKETPIRCEVEGKENRVIFLIDEGKTVQKGDLLVEFETADLKTRINRQEIEYQSALSAFKQSTEKLGIRKSLNETEIKGAELQLRFSKMDLKKFKEGQWPLDLKKQESAITLAKAELVRAKGRLDWTRVLQKKGYATRSDLESDELSVKRKELEIDQEKERLKMMTNYDYPQSLARLESDVEKYGQELDRTKRKAKAELAQSMSDLQAKKANYKSNEDQLTKLKADLVKSKVIAPEAGLVVYHKDYWRGDAITLGGTAHFRQRLLNLPDTSVLTVQVKVHESRIAQLGVGQIAYVTLDTMPGRRFKGTVKQVAPMPDPQSFWNPGLKVYSIQVIINDALPPDVKPGLSARAEIIVDKLEDALIVPIQSITTIDKRQVAYVMVDGKAEMRTVTIGAFNETHVEIKDGLTEGDRILLAPPSKDEALALGLSIVGTDDVKPSDVVKVKKPTRRKPTGRPPIGMSKKGKSGK